MIKSTLRTIRKYFIATCLVCFCCVGTLYASETDILDNEQQALEEEYFINSLNNQDMNNDASSETFGVSADAENSAEENNLQIIKSKTPGVVELKISNLNAGEIKGVQFAVWSKKNGQDDLKWYMAEAKEDGIYSYNLLLSQHKGLGEYSVHAYAITSNGSKLIKMKDFEASVPVVSDISADNIDEDAGTFQVHARNIQNGEYINKVQFAVWSEANGQDDIIWYVADADSTGGYEKTINIGSHKYSVGKYQIHVYVTDLTGDVYMVGKISQNMDVQINSLVVEEEQNSYTYKAEMDVVVPGGAQDIVFPVWSEINGQDDIKWYNAKKTENGTYEAIISIKNHKGLGIYQLHVYARMKSGEMRYIGKDTFSVTAPKIEKMSITDVDKEKGVFQIKLSDIENGELIRGIQIPTWSTVGGQDDIKWYQAKKNEQGQYIVDVNIKNHKYSMGNYNAHVYVTDITGCVYLAETAEHKVAVTPGELEITQDVSNEKQYIIELKNACVPGGMSEVVFPIWSAVNGQDDIRWYTAKKLLDGTYQLKMSVGDHKGLGVYHVHAYGRMPNGTLCIIGQTSFNVKAPEIGNIEISYEKKEKGEFQVKITGVKNSELIRTIQVPIWSEKNQGDIVWYTAQKDLNGDYVVDVNIVRHKYNVGNYNVHVYVTDVTGGVQFAGMSVSDMRAEYTDFTAEDTDGTEKDYLITLSGLKMPGGEKGVSFAVWGQTSGQNDIRWYQGEKVADGTYRCSVKIRDHKEMGVYNVHAYCTSKINIQYYIGATTFVVEKTPVSIINTSEIDGTAGTFKITATGVMAPSGIEKVRFAVWCAENQSDLSWYDAVKLSEGTYTANVKVANHAQHFGDYKIHLYATMGNGVSAIGGEAETHIDAKNYIYNIRIDSTRSEVGIIGTTASLVQFPTWSTAYGQDDVIWYKGNNCGNGKWNVIVNSLSHNSAGTYITHVYVTDSDGNMEKIGDTTYTLDRLPPDQTAMQGRANLYGSPTPFLILVNKSTHKVGVFQGWQGNWNMIAYWDCADGAPNTPTVEGIFSVGSRGHYFDAYGCRQYWWTQFYGAYLFHSVIYTKQGQLYDGRLGMGLSHGCVRLQIDNAKWIYDVIPSGTTVVVYR